MYARDLGKIQNVLVSAMRCLDCRDSRCVDVCPEHVDVRAVMQLIVDRTPPDRRPSWTNESDAATRDAMEGIESSFES